MTTTLEPDFLVAVVRMITFKGRKMLGAQAALLHLALKGVDFTAAELPGEIVGDSRHIAGAATGALIAQGLLVVVDRIKSPRPEAKGRKLDVLRLAAGKRSTAITWLKANALPVSEGEETIQQRMAL